MALAALRCAVGRLPEPAPLKVRRQGKTETDRFVRHKIELRTEKNYWLPAFLFVPKGLSAPVPAVVSLHGHGGIGAYVREPDEKMKEYARSLAGDYAPRLAEDGYVVIAPLQRGLNGGPNSCQRISMNAFLLGRTPVGLRVWDAMRCVDFLEGLDDVDSSRIATAGLSGGGTTALFFAALDSRVRAAMIAGYLSTFRDSIFAMHHCICNCVPGLMREMEMADIAALIAPRPLLSISGTKDPIFPIKAARAAFRRLEEVYTLLGARQNLDKDFFDGPHAWSHRKAPGFLRRHLG